MGGGKFGRQDYSYNPPLPTATILKGTLNKHSLMDVYYHTVSRALSGVNLLLRGGSLVLERNGFTMALSSPMIKWFINRGGLERYLHNELILFNRRYIFHKIRSQNFF